MKTRLPLTSIALAFLFAFATTGRLDAIQELDWGDAPDPTYPTLAANNGANHLYVPHIYLGNLVDPEPNGQPSINANGDDNDVLYPSVGDDEDGVSFDTALTPGQAAQITVTASVNGQLDAWIDFTGDGDWYDAAEQIFTSQALSVGANTLNFNVPASAQLGFTYARFRFNASGIALQPGGSAPDGEVEDYWLAIEDEDPPEEIDWGDAPDQPYPVLAANNGANHQIVPGMHLGSSVDGDPNGQPDINALGDDNDGNDDEDGVVFTSSLMSGMPATVTVTASQPGLLDAWIDFNGNGNWGDVPDAVFTTVPLNAGANPLTFTVPVGTPTGRTYARFRYSSAGNLAFTGAAPDGEVEDYEVWVETEQDDSHKMHWPQYPDPDGWDVFAGYTPPTDIHPEGLQKVLADDFLCTSSGWITNITFWGSWFNDYWEQAPFQGITNIHLSLHLDIPDPDGDGPEYSRPGEQLWEWDLDPMTVPPEFFSITEEPESWQGFYNPNTGEWELNNHMRYFRYDIGFMPGETIYQTNGTIYWLDISVETLEGMWGWKTSRSPHFNDDAVWADLPVDDPAKWNELRDPVYGHSLDLAFIIDGIPDDPTNDWGDLPDAYNTLSGNSGANHTVVQGFMMGGLIDAELDGLPSAAADGDDLNNQPDEDGVTFNTLFIPGITAQFDVWASAPGQLDVWMDVDGDGVWTLPNEHVFSGGVAGGLNPLSFLVPSSTPLGQNVLRYRFTSSPSAYPGGAPIPTGSANDGEVEDYVITVQELDWGDAPDPTYPTLAASGGASHLISSGPYLGHAIDADLDGQPSLLADGDDTDIQGDDEDGVSFVSPFIPGTVAQVNVDAGGGGFGCVLDAWVDFNSDGDWTDSGEQIFTSLTIGYLPVNLSFQVPASATQGTNTYARFRVSYAGGLSPGGFAPDGEVEDYMVFIEEAKPVDWGDAPDNLQAPVFPTLMANNGAHHIIVPGMFLGGLVDPEPDGQPTMFASGDDNDALYPSLGDDEDGVQFTTQLQPGGFAGVDVFASAPGTLDAWIDFNNDGDWADSGERIFNGQSLNSGINSLIFAVPTTAAQGMTVISRFRYSSAGVPSYTGLALDGEVEDHVADIEPIIAQALDYGDADVPYPTVIPLGGASHLIVPGVVLGATIDGEADGQPDPQAQGDDLNIIYPGIVDDEDGVVFTSKLVAGTNATVTVVAGVSGGKLDAWIDFGADGAWGAGDQIFTALPVGAGVNNLVFAVPTPPAALGPTYARFRISTAGSLPPGGPATDGEVEDYQVKIVQPVPSPALEITNLYFTVSNTITWVEWNSQSNILYQVQSSTNLTTNVWVDVGSTWIGPHNWQTNSAGPDAQFYRVLAPFAE